MWQSRPIFISSTFADMQAERDYLLTRVFPELEERLRARRHNLEWVDLRVGLATASASDEHLRELHVLKVCLDEVRRCRPFLIVLLGDRYGWVPPEDRIKAAAEEAREAFSPEFAGRSVTDLEIEFGVLCDPEQQPRSFFYVREPLPYADMPAGVAALYSEDYATDSARADRKRRLATLKGRIGTRLPGRIVPYRAAWDSERQRVTGLEDFGRRVLEDVWSELETETRAAAAAPRGPWQQAERAALEDFIDDRARNFVGRQALVADLSRLCLSPAMEGASWGACVIGEPGAGKSALFGAIDRRLRGSEVFLLSHAAGASVAAASVDSMLRRWIGELAEALGADPDLGENADPATTEAAFARLLGAMAQRRRVVVLVDALDQFAGTTRGRFATWLPRPWPVNARLIATAVVGDASKALGERRGLGTMPLPPLDDAEAREIVAGICRRYHRVFDPEVIEALLAKRGPEGPSWANPLWLVLAVEELNLLDGDDFVRADREYTGAPGERLNRLMCDTVGGFPADIRGLYVHTFARAEELFGARLARGFLGLIAISRSGWRESDFRILLPRASGESWDELKFAQLRRLFRGQLRRRSQVQWDFNHAQMRAAVRGQLAAWAIAEKDLHGMIADRLLGCATDDPLHVSETIVHLLGSEDYDRAAGYYGDPWLNEAEVEGATRALADAIVASPNGAPADAAREACRLLDTADSSVHTLLAERVLCDLSDAIANNAPVDARTTVVDSAKEAFQRLLRSKPGAAWSDPRDALWQRLGAAFERLGNLQVAQGDMAGARVSYGYSVDIAERLAQATPGNAQCQRGVAAGYIQVGNVLKAQGNLAAALKSYRDSLAVMQRLAQADPGDARWQRDLSVLHDHLGGGQEEQGDLAGALKSYRDSLAILAQLAESDPGNAVWQRDLAVALNKVGDMLRAQDDSAANITRLPSPGVAPETQGNLRAALQSYRDSLAIRERLAHSDPGNAEWQHDLAVSYQKLGTVHSEQGDTAGALEYYRDSLAIVERLAHADPGNAEWQHALSAALSKIGEAQAAQGDLSGALTSYRESDAIMERQARSDPSNAQWHYDLALMRARFGSLLETQGDLAAALVYYRNSLLNLEELVKSDPGNARWQRSLATSQGRVGNVLAAQGDLAGALSAYRHALAIGEQQAQSDPNDIGWQRDMALAHAQLASVFAKAGETRKERDALRQGRAVMARLTKMSSTNAGWQHDLAWFDDMIARPPQSVDRAPAGRSIWSRIFER